MMKLHVDEIQSTAKKSATPAPNLYISNVANLIEKKNDK